MINNDRYFLDRDDQENWIVKSRSGRRELFGPDSAGKLAALEWIYLHSLCIPEDTDVLSDALEESEGVQ